MRFPSFEGEWIETNFGSACKIATGNKNTQDKEEDGIYPFYVRSSIIERINTYTFDGEAILTAGDGVGVGKVFHYTKGKIGVHQRVYILSGFKDFVGHFLFYYFSTKFRQRVSKLSAKNSVDSVRYDMIAKMPLIYPERHEQTNISGFLSLLDERISTQSKIIGDLSSLMNGETARLLSQTARLKRKTALDGWELKKIKDVLTIGSGKDYRHLKSGSIPVLGSGGLMTYVDSFLYEGETVCIGRKGTINKPIFHEGKLWTVDTLFYTYLFKHTFPKYIYYVFKTINWKEYSEASGVPSLSKSTIENIKIPIPSLEEQNAITNYLTAIERKIELEQKLLSEYKRQKIYLLRNLFI